MIVSLYNTVDGWWVYNGGPSPLSTAKGHAKRSRMDSSRKRRIYSCFFGGGLSTHEVWKQKTSRGHISACNCRRMAFSTAAAVPVDTHDDRVVTLVRLEGELLLGLELLALELGDLLGEHNGRLDGRVDTVGLDRDDKMAAVLEEHVRVDGDDARLVRLCHVRKDDVDLTAARSPLRARQPRESCGAVEQQIRACGRRTMPTSMRYFSGRRASSMMGITLVRFLAMLIRSRPERGENSTA